MNTTAPTPPLVLVFAASDPTAGAGIQADLLTLASLGCHPLTALTAITVQDTVGVESVHPVAAETLERQARVARRDVSGLEHPIGGVPLGGLLEAVRRTLMTALFFGKDQAALEVWIDRLRERNAELAVINTIQQGMAGSLDFQAIVDTVGDKLREVFATKGRDAWVALLAPAFLLLALIVVYPIGTLIFNSFFDRRYIMEVCEGLVPELQRRGVTRKAYAHKHLRDNLLEF